MNMMINFFLFNIINMEDKSRIEQYICTMTNPNFSSYFKDGLNPIIKEWVETHRYLYTDDLTKSKLSEEAKEWLNNYLDGTFVGVDLSDEIINAKILEELSQYRLDSNISLYRGMHFNIMDIELLENIGTMFPLKTTFPSSWTWTYKIAENFAKLGTFNYVIERVFYPEEVIVDLRLIPEYCKFRSIRKDVKSILKSIQDEVIVKQGNYECNIVNKFIPNDMKVLLKKENYKGLKKFKTFLEKNKDKFMDFYREFIEPTIFNTEDYGKRLGGLESCFFNKEVSFCYKMNYNKGVYTLEYMFITKVSSDSENIVLMRKIYKALQKYNKPHKKVNKIYDCNDLYFLKTDCEGCDGEYIQNKKIVNYYNKIEKDNLEDIIDECIWFIKLLYQF